MAIRREYRKYYGPRWRAARRAALEHHGDFCDTCLRSHRMLNWAHKAHDPKLSNCLAFLCPSCHAIHDTPQRIAMTRRNRARRYGQLWLCAEIEYAPYPVRMWPDRLRQLSLFGEVSI